MSSQLDFGYRPSTYFHPIDFVTWLRATAFMGGEYLATRHEGDTLEGPSELRHPEPLCLGQLINFFLGAWRLDRCIECNIEHERHPERMLNFARGESAFYPEFASFIREEVEDLVNAELNRSACEEAEWEGIDPPAPPVRCGLPLDSMQPVIDAIEAWWETTPASHPVDRRSRRDGGKDTPRNPPRCSAKCARPDPGCAALHPGATRSSTACLCSTPRDASRARATATTPPQASAVATEGSAK